MKDENKTKEQLIQELEETRQQVSLLGLMEAEHKQTEAELSKHREHLEELVTERTDKLKKADKQLRQDITERKQMEETLRETRDYLDSLIRYANAPIIVWDSEMRITLFNTAFEQLTGYKTREVIGRPLSMLFPEESRDKSLAKIKRTASGKFWESEEIPIQGKDGEVRIVLWNSANVYDKSGKVHLATIAQGQDITERKQAEERLKHLRLVLRAIRNVNQLIIRAKDREKLLKDICDNLVKTRGYSNAWITLLDESGKLVAHAESGLGKSFLPVVERLKRGQLTACGQRALKQSEAVVTKDPASTCTDCPMSSYAGRSAVIVRLEYKEKVYGLLSVSVPRELATDVEELSLFHEVATDIAFALYNMELDEQRKQAEAALQESEESLKAYLDSAPDGVYLNDLKGVFLYGNKKAEKIIGYKREELIGNSFTKLNLLPAKYLAKAGKLLALNAMGRATGPDEFELIRKDGTRIWTEINTAPIRQRDRTVVIGFVRDITERKQAEEALRESEEKYRTLINNIKAGIFRSTPEPAGRFLEVNAAMEQVTGYRRKELLQMNATDLYVNPAERKQVLEEVTSGKGRVAREVRFRKKDGSEIVVLDRKTAVRNEAGEVMYFDGIMEDLTEHKKAEERTREAEGLKELDRMRTELLSNVSHELRTPLATIKGYATMLLDYDKRLRHDEKRKYLRFIDRASDRLVGLIDQLLDMSRLEAGLVEITKKPASISKLIKEAVDEAQVRKPQRRLVMNLPRRLPRLNIDAKRVRQVVDNLIDNAIKYSEEETEIVISAHQLRRKLVVSVTDQGIGIPSDDLPKVFERIYRARQKRVIEVGGAGLGLSICQKLVEAHKGKIWIESKEGQGTTASFNLPLATPKKRGQCKKA